MVNRKGIFRYVMTLYGPQSDKYFFETLATDGETLLAVAAVNDDNTPQTLQLEMACNQGIALPQCQAVYQSRRYWAQMVLGVQFATFPYQQID